MNALCVFCVLCLSVPVSCFLLSCGLVIDNDDDDDDDVGVNVNIGSFFYTRIFL